MGSGQDVGSHLACFSNGDVYNLTDLLIALVVNLEADDLRGRSASPGKTDEGRSIHRIGLGGLNERSGQEKRHRTEKQKLARVDHWISSTLLSCPDP